jgi:hypothetical protein
MNLPKNQGQELILIQMMIGDAVEVAEALVVVAAREEESLGAEVEEEEVVYLVGGVVKEEDAIMSRNSCSLSKINMTFITIPPPPSLVFFSILPLYDATLLFFLKKKTYIYTDINPFLSPKQTCSYTI